MPVKKKPKVEKVLYMGIDCKGNAAFFTNKKEAIEWVEDTEWDGEAPIARLEDELCSSALNILGLKNKAVYAISKALFTPLIKKTCGSCGSNYYK